ncbi:MAG: sugar ABC transporter substrate-binding protein [Clostridiales bacterium]|jgi:ribose transport system substrate-binding protein|nr:sugar ABC transporter substrate-binding protein [Clostridiales bacterium]
MRNLKKNKVIMLAAVISISAGFLIIFIGMTLYRNRLNDLGAEDSLKYNTYKYHYALISEEADAPFWEAIYEGALESGKGREIYVERIGSSLPSAYPLRDLMKMAIASKVDGIIIEPNGEEEIIDLINIADEAGIPVITVLNDEPNSKRKSFVGVNSYNQGQIYGKQVLEVVKAGKKNVTILLNSDSHNAGMNVIDSGIREMVAGNGVWVNSVNVNTQSTFSSEEDIRNIIKDSQNPTEVLVCLTAIDTRCAYQAVVDYNKVGVINIIGYYDSDLILSAIQKGIIHSTMSIDAKQMGAYCVEALNEYMETGQVSDYFSVDVYAINNDNIDDYIRAQSEGEEKKD